MENIGISTSQSIFINVYRNTMSYLPHQFQLFVIVVKKERKRDLYISQDLNSKIICSGNKGGKKGGGLFTNKKYGTL